MLTNNKKIIKQCRPILEDTLHNDFETYLKLFFWEKEKVPRSKNKNNFSILEKSGLLARNNNGYYAKAMAYPLKDKIIVTDFVFSLRCKKILTVGRRKIKLYTRKRNQVWAMLPHETPQIIKSLKVEKGDIVLDLATGSGAIALFCADKAKRVYATDINPKAIKYAKFNAILNDLEDKIEFRIGDLFSPVKNLKFDYIVWNGPTVAAPNVSDPNSTYALSDFGGPDGADFTRRFIDEVRNYVKKDFIIQFYDSCLGNKNRGVSIDYLTQKFENENFRVEINHLNKHKGIPLSITQKLFRKYRYAKHPLAIDNFSEVNKAEKKWFEWIKKRKLNFVHFAIVTITPRSGKKLFLVEETPPRSIITPSFIYKEWHSMNESQIRSVLKKEGTI